MEHTLEESATQVLVPTIAITDGELLMRFAQHGDEQAFTAIVEKHGRLVWTVCWQILREHHAIEDAFQSTFFILAKQARSIRSCDSLCGWLYRVAYRTALRSRASNKTRLLSTLGSEADTMEEWSELDEKLRSIEQDEQRAALLEELQALPEKYQQVLALCYLEGKTRRKIADELGCSLETVKGRLARGRQVLRHRLIRRGVSLSLAMAAMAIPAKVATAAVTPNLIGLTVAGATAWAAGALGSAKNASGVSTTKSATATSAQVIHLANQGSFAMSLASFAKPAAIAFVLLGAVSGTLALGSGDGSPSREAHQAINLALETADATLASENLVVEGDASIVTAAATQEVDSTSKKKTKNLVVQTFESAGGPKKMPALPRGATLSIAGTPAPADMLISGLPRVPLIAPPNVRVPKLDLKLQLKIVELETMASQLQLEAKQLEIEAMGAADEANKKALLQQSQEKLAMAEAEKIKIQIEQQHAQIVELKEALEAQANELGKQAQREAELAESYARRAADQAQDADLEATRRTLRIQERAVYVDPNSDQPFAAASSQVTSAIPYPVVAGLPAWEQSFEAQQGSMSLKPGDRIQVEIFDGDSNSINICTVEPMGTVALGAEYGRAEVKGLSIVDAEEVIAATIKKVMQSAKVQVTYLHPTVSLSSPLVPSRNVTYPRYALPATTGALQPTSGSPEPNKPDEAK